MSKNASNTSDRVLIIADWRPEGIEPPFAPQRHRVAAAKAWPILAGVL